MFSEPSNSSQPRNLTLEDAWQRFAKYDKNAGLAQKLFTTQQKAVLAIGVAATVLAVAYSVLEPRMLPWIGADASDRVKQVLRFFVVTTPIVLSILTAWTVKFNMGINWIMLRSGAETLKKEIFLYRTRVGDYSPANTETESRDVQLARKAQSISKRVMETQVNQTGLLPYEGQLPPKYGTADGDDGFSDLTPDQFVQYRVEDQFNYYQKKAVRLAKESQRFQWFILILGGVSTALGAFGQEVWIAVSSALATAFTSFLEFKRVETNLISCNIAADDLYNLRTWWRSLSDSQKVLQENVEALVTGTEAVIQGENAGWLQEMKDALSKLYGDTKGEDKGTATSQTSYQGSSYSNSQAGVYGTTPSSPTITYSDTLGSAGSSTIVSDGSLPPDDEFSASAYTNVPDALDDDEDSSGVYTNVQGLLIDDDEDSPGSYTNIPGSFDDEDSPGAYTNIPDSLDEDDSPGVYTNLPELLDDENVSSSSTNLPESLDDEFAPNADTNTDLWAEESSPSAYTNIVEPLEFSEIQDEPQFEESYGSSGLDMNQDAHPEPSR